MGIPGSRFAMPVIVIASMAILGCAAQGPGQGPLSVSNNVASGYERFKKDVGAAYFAVSEDGRTYGYSYCTDFVCRGNARAGAIAACERSSRGAACYIFASGEEILWKGKVTGLPTD